MRSLGGCLTLADLESVVPVWLDPLTAAYRGLDVHTLPPPCEGFQYLLTLRILDDFDIASMQRDGIEHLDAMYRAIRLAAGTRIAYNNPTDERLAALLAGDAVQAHRNRVRDGRPIEAPTEQFVGTMQQHTTSFSVADGEGNVVCITQSLGARFGCGVVVPGHGVCLNNFLYWGEVDPRGPNALRPGGPLALPMAPSIATRNGRPVLALGTPGSYGICQTQPQALVQHIDFDLGIQQAIEAPRARLWDGRRVQVESRISPDVIKALCDRGHAAETTAAWTSGVGGMHGIAIDPGTGVMTGGCDARRDGFVASA